MTMKAAVILAIDGRLLGDDRGRPDGARGAGAADHHGQASPGGQSGRYISVVVCDKTRSRASNMSGC